ncbi:MAG: AMP-binding protein [Pseudomonadota bacterium]
MDERFLPHKVIREDRPDGTVLLSSGYPLGPVARNTGEWQRRWAAEAPSRAFLAERSGPGWRTMAYGEALEMTQAIAAALLDRGMGAETPILILSGNGVDHGLLMLAAHYAGVPVVPIAEQYSLIPAARGRLTHVAGLTRPAMVFAADGAAFGDALADPRLDGVEVVVSANPPAGATPFSDLLRGGAADAEAANARVGPETLAKILMTSGSTSDPKGVITTQGMLTTNQTQVGDSFPFVRARPPEIIDWLPWNHCFGGSHNFNLILANGGTLWIDDGKPMKGPLFDRTMENHRLADCTMSFNVPVGHAQMLEVLRADAVLRRRFFDGMDMIFYAGAALPQAIWDGFEELAEAEGGPRPLITSAWGLTETAPSAIEAYEPMPRAGIVGAPLGGLSLKMVPDPDDPGRYEVRIKGPSITPGYYRDPAKTVEAFDEEGYFRSGDAMRFEDPVRAEAGLIFDGRMGEDFKLTTGVWVRAANLRLEALAALAPLAADLVVAGHGRDEVGLLIVPAARAEAELNGAPDGRGALTGPLAEEIARRLAPLADAQRGSSLRIARALVLAEPPSVGDGEITAKGNLNNKKMLARRAALVDRLYDDGDGAVLRIGANG